MLEMHQSKHNTFLASLYLIVVKIPHLIFESFMKMDFFFFFFYSIIFQLDTLFLTAKMLIA